MTAQTVQLLELMTKSRLLESTKCWTVPWTSLTPCWTIWSRRMTTCSPSCKTCSSQTKKREPSCRLSTLRLVTARTEALVMAQAGTQVMAQTNTDLQNTEGQVDIHHGLFSQYTCSVKQFQQPVHKNDFQ